MPVLSQSELMKNDPLISFSSFKIFTKLLDKNN